ncbi:hypothetical protein LZ31DRAFT_257452 [Colletotrichum somersetense]|nr:hypothetical protein LZ31DRAFT_257452 [Colletotrichum somersetense]
MMGLWVMVRKSSCSIYEIVVLLQRLVTSLLGENPSVSAPLHPCYLHCAMDPAILRGRTRIDLRRRGPSVFSPMNSSGMLHRRVIRPAALNIEVGCIFVRL